MNAIFKGLNKGKGKKCKEKPVVNEYLRYKQPLNDTEKRRVDSPGGEGNERRLLSKLEQALCDFYDREPGDEKLSEGEKARNRQLPKQTPNQNLRAKGLLGNTTKDPKVSKEEFARLVDDPQYHDLVARATPEGQGTLRSSRAKQLLRNTTKDPKVSKEEFAKRPYIGNDRYQKGKSPFIIPRKKKLQLRL